MMGEMEAMEAEESEWFGTGHFSIGWMSEWMIEWDSIINNLFYNVIKTELIEKDYVN